MSLFDVFSEVVNVPGQLITGKYTGMASKKEVPIPETIRSVGMISPVGGIKTAWNALGSTGKIVLVGGASAAGGYLLGGFGGGMGLFGTKKEQTVSQAQTLQPVITPTITPTQIIQPVVTQPITTTYYQQDYSTSTITGSPFASISKKTEAMTSAEPTANIPSTQYLPFTSDVGQSQSATQEQGMDWGMLAAIAGVALVAYGYVTHRK